MKTLRLISSALIFLAAGHLVAAPGDDAHTYSSLDTEIFPPYSSFTDFSDAINGSSVGSGSQAAAYRFTARVSGPMEYIQVILLANGGGTETSARVTLYTDAGGVLGGILGSYPVTGITVGRWSGYFAYHNYGNPKPNEPVVTLIRGHRYWLGVEPLTPLSSVYWAASLSTEQVKKYVNVGGQSSYPGNDQNVPAGYTVAVFEPYPPQIQSPGVPLVEGEQVPDADQGVTLASVGAVPQTPTLGSILIGKKKVPALLGSDGKVKLQLGSDPTILDGLDILKIGDPSGDTALLTLRRHPASGADPAVTAANDVILVAGLRTPPLRIVARTGDAIEGGGGAVIRKFLSIDGDGTSPFFLIQLSGTGVTAKNNIALAAATGTGAAHILVRKDDPRGPAKVSIIGTLLGYNGTLGEGRWRATDDSLGVRLTFNDKSTQLFTIPSTATTQADWNIWATTGTPLAAPLAAPLAGEVIKTIGTPGFGPDGVTFPATLEIGPGVTKADDTVLLQQNAAGLTLIAREGSEAPGTDAAPLDGVKFKSFGNPVQGPAGSIAFTANLVVKSGNTGIWWTDGTAPLRLIVRAGDPAPQYSDFAKFTNLVLPDSPGSTPIFEAKLAGTPSADVTAKTSDGIWALDNTGKVTLLARNGSYLYLNSDLFGTISGISALSAATTSSGAAHGIDADGSVRINATIANRATPGKKRAQFTIPIPQP